MYALIILWLSMYRTMKNIDGSSIMIMFKKAFTLAEILIVLVIIGVLTMILLPVAFQSSPDEDVMKFKKAHNTLFNVIKELVSSDAYYKDGDLGIKIDGSLIDGSHKEDVEYFCKTIADTINAKEVNCAKQNSKDAGWIDAQMYSGVADNMEDAFDKRCKEKLESSNEIVLADGVVFYQTNPSLTFGINNNSNTIKEILDTPDGEYPNTRLMTIQDDDGFLRMYKEYCIDIDGINKGEDPFGYGIRTDGKIYIGKKASEWLNKSIQKE